MGEDIYMGNENTNWGQSVAGIVIKDGKVLLARHTYGNGKGMLIIPGGYVNLGETPQDALKREFLEETNVTVKPVDIIGIRFNMHDWYVVFRAEYISGKEQSDQDENGEVVWVDVCDALSREEVPQLTKILLKSAVENEKALTFRDYQGNIKDAPYSLWSV